MAAKTPAATTATPLPMKAALVGAAPAVEVEVVGASWAAEVVAVGSDEAELVVVLLPPPPPVCALEGSRVPHCDLMSDLHLSCSLELSVLAAMQFSKALSQRNCRPS